MSGIVNRLNQKEAIEELEKFGIKVVMKPVAIVPMYGRDGVVIGGEEIDIYEALQKIENRQMFINSMGDPFSIQKS